MLVMTTFEVIKSVPVELHRDGRPMSYLLGIAEMPGRPRLFGVLDSTGTRMTHMCYGLDYFEPEECLKMVRERGGWFYFDAGTTRPELKIEADDLELVFRELGVI